MKALKLLQSAPSVEVRANQFIPRIQKSIQKDILDAIQVEIDELEDTKFELMTFSLDTDVNRGQSTMTKQECEGRFVEYMEACYQQDLLKAKLKSKQIAFDYLFKD